MTITAIAPIESAAQSPSARYSIERKKNAGTGASTAGVQSAARRPPSLWPIAADAASVASTTGSMIRRMKTRMSGVSPKAVMSGAVSMWNSGAWLSKMSRYSSSPWDHAQATCRCCHSSESNFQRNAQRTWRTKVNTRNRGAATISHRAIGLSPGAPLPRTCASGGGCP